MHTALSNEIVIVAGLGEVGNPLLEILSRSYECIGVDIAPVEVDRPCSVMHVCYPFQLPDFVGTTASYIEKYKPALTVINSTLAVAHPWCRSWHRRVAAGLRRIPNLRSPGG